MKSEEIKSKIKTLIELNKLDWKHSINNYSATLVGIFIYTTLLFLILNFYIINIEEFGILSPVVLIFLIQLCIKMLIFVPRPVTTFEVTDYIEK